MENALKSSCFLKVIYKMQNVNRNVQFGFVMISDLFETKET